MFLFLNFVGNIFVIFFTGENFWEKLHYIYVVLTFVAEIFLGKYLHLYLSFEFVYFKHI